MSHARRRNFGPLGATDLSIEAGAAIGATANRLARDWHPTGYYTPQDIIGVFAQLDRVYVEARKPLGDFLQYITPTHELIREQPYTWTTRRALTNVDGARAAFWSRYVAASISAASRGVKYIDAPGFKTAVVAFLKAMSLAVAQGRQARAEYQTFLDDHQSLIGSLWSAAKSFAVSSGLASVANAVGDAIMKIGGVAVDVVKAAGGAVMTIADTVGTLLTVAKWGLIAFIGITLYRELSPGATRSRAES